MKKRIWLILIVCIVAVIIVICKLLATSDKLEKAPESKDIVITKAVEAFNNKSIKEENVTSDSSSKYNYSFDTGLKIKAKEGKNNFEMPVTFIASGSNIKSKGKEYFDSNLSINVDFTINGKDTEKGDDVKYTNVYKDSASYYSYSYIDTANKTKNYYKYDSYDDIYIIISEPINKKGNIAEVIKQIMLTKASMNENLVKVGKNNCYEFIIKGSLSDDYLAPYLDTLQEAYEKNANETGDIMSTYIAKILKDDRQFIKFNVTCYVNANDYSIQKVSLDLSETDLSGLLHNENNVLTDEMNEYNAEIEISKLLLTIEKEDGENYEVTLPENAMTYEEYISTYGYNKDTHTADEIVNILESD